MQIAIIGCGAAGILLLLELQRKGISTKDICVIDPYFDGGSLRRKWGSIQSNTRWEQIRDSLSLYDSAKKCIELLNKKYKDEQTVVLSDLGWLLHQSVEPFLCDIDTHLTRCTEICMDKENTVTLLLENMKYVKCDIVFLCQGGQQKALDYGKPVIPLEIALDATLLKRYVKPDDTVCVFGTAHSGTLAIKHLIECEANVIGFYKGDVPFLYARDGNYDGIKQESADIADAIRSDGIYKSVKLYPIQDVKNLLKSLSKSKWVLSSIGFEGSPMRIQEDGNMIDSMKYSSDTGQLYKNIYGFGLAYPGITEIDNKSYKDIGIPSFIQQIQKCLPEILERINHTHNVDGAEQRIQ